ncbi:MAG TPA: hypothetical protein VJS69_11325 [Candidatus Krumholzibacteria bacterium]|nr:hypothetical protein [Candidatus Krumholzibacteria bacterium]
MRHAVLLMVLLAACTASARAQAPDSTMQHSRFPFMAEEARKRGHTLPLPYGLSLVLTGLGNRKIEVTDVRIGVNNQPQSVSNFLDIGSTSDVFNANLKGDLWLLPFFNVYGLVGYVHNESKTHARVTVPKPGPTPGDVQYDTDVETSLDGIVGGLGGTLAAGYLNFFSVVDFCYIRSDLGFDDAFTAKITSFRVGYNGVLAETPMQLWLGAGDWDTAATAKGHSTLPNGDRLDFEADQQPVNNWMYDIGGNFQFTPHWLLVVDAGADFNGGFYVVLGPTYRFGQ